MTVTLNISITQGEDYNTPLLFFDDAGEPEDFTGCTAIAQLRTAYDDPTALLTLSTADGSFTIENGEIIPHITYSQSRALYAGTYLMDVFVRHANGFIRNPRLLQVTINSAVTVVVPPVPGPSPSPSPAPSPSPSPSPAPTYNAYILTGVF